MISLSNDYPQFLTFATNPKGQVIASILILGAIILFNSFFYIFQPYDGMEVYQEPTLGEVHEVYPGGPADTAGVRIGDQILEIDNKPIDPLRSEPRYRAGVKAGDAIRYKLERNGEPTDLSLTIGSYSENLPLLGVHLGIQILSIGLWMISLILTLFSPQDDVRTRLLGLGFLMAGLTVAAGGASGWNSFWGATTIQKVLLSLLSPVILAAHLTFPSVSFPKHRKGVIYTVFVVSCLLSILVIIDDWILTPRGYSFREYWGIYLRQWILIFFIVSWLIAVALLIRNRFRSPDPEIRRQTGIIIWGMVLGIGPFFTFTLLPYLFFGQEYLAGSFTILFLLLLPLAYTYVIFQRKLLVVDFIINRIVVWFTLVLLILIISILIFGLLVILFNLPPQLPIYGGLVAVLIAMPFASLAKVVQTQVDRILYGSHYDFTTVTSSLSNQLAQPLDRNRLVELLTQHLPQQMGIQRAALFLTVGNGLDLEGTNENQNTFPMVDELRQVLLEYRWPVRAAQLWTERSLANVFPFNPQISLKEFEWGQVYAPLIAESKLQGILVLGKRVSGDVYSDRDLHIIATVAEQGALAATNLRLVEALRGLTQQLVRAEEEQRKRLASDLHDTVLQELFYIKRGLRKYPDNPELLDYMEGIIQNLRQIIKAQRPPLLDRGLLLTLQGLVEDMQKRAGSSTAITWHSSLDGTLSLSDDKAASIFRIAQEALNNAVKHAHARRIEVKLEPEARNGIRLIVKDDGIGAPEVEKDGKLAQNHFGLLLMQERATMIGADLKIHALLGEGTAIVLEVQL